MRILGIESSCDETAAAVVEDGQRLLSNVVNSQIDIHAAYGGVIPEVAARSHLEVIMPVVNQALADADCTWEDIDGIAVTYAPGLIGSLLIGSLAARTLALIHDKPLYPVHHVEGHVYANFLTSLPETNSEAARDVEDSAFPAEPDKTKTQMASGASSTTRAAEAVVVKRPLTKSGINHLTLPSRQPDFPLLALIVSGGHTQLALFQGHGDYQLLGQTQDDAVGEAFDKVAKIIGLPYPGGPSVSIAAEKGDPDAFAFPKAKFTCKHAGPHSKATASNGTSRTAKYGERAAEPSTKLGADEHCYAYDFSFSGLKTAVLRQVQSICGVGYDFPSHQLPERLDDVSRHNVAASFQRVAIETLVDKTLKAYHEHSPASVVIAGGVAANQELRRQLSDALPMDIEYAPMSLCTDNAAMIATLGHYMAEQLPASDPRSLEVIPSLSMTKTSWSKS